MLKGPFCYRQGHIVIFQDPKTAEMLIKQGSLTKSHLASQQVLASNWTKMTYKTGEKAPGGQMVPSSSSRTLPFPLPRPFWFFCNVPGERALGGRAGGALGRMGKGGGGGPSKRHLGPHPHIWGHSRCETPTKNQQLQCRVRTLFLHLLSTVLYTKTNRG